MPFFQKNQKPDQNMNYKTRGKKCISMKTTTSTTTTTPEIGIAFVFVAICNER